MRFRNRTLYNCITEAIQGAEKLLQIDSPLMMELAKKNDWKWDSDSGEHVVEKLLAPSVWTIGVYVFRSWNPFSKEIGHQDDAGIHINLRKLPSLSKEELIGHLLHEYAHFKGFTHGSNRPSQDKSNYSVPYWLSENAKKL